MSDSLTPWTVAWQASLFVGFPRQEHWNGLPRPFPGDLPNPGIEPASLISPALAGRLFTARSTLKALIALYFYTFLVVTLNNFP